MKTAYLALALMLVLPACAAPPPSVAPTTVTALIGEARCDTQAQCRTIAVGAKACGGPAGYRAWSTRDTDETALRAAADREAQAERKAIEREGRMSNCAVVSDPGAVCRPRASDGVNTCQLPAISAGPGGRAD